MQFPTLTFGVFFLIVFSIVWALQASNEWRKIALLLASWFFYGWGDPRPVALLFLSAFVNWLVGRWLTRADVTYRTAVLWLGISINLLTLGYFKYASFFLEQTSTGLAALGFARDVPLMQVLLPVGVSFFTFQGISYLVDIYRRELQPARFLDVALLMSFFPHIAAGPIVRGSDLLPQFAETPQLKRGAVAAGLLLITWGLFKKTIVASELATALVDPAFNDPAHRTTFDLLFGAYGYAVQIYCDFSAYSDMAVGFAALLGYSFPANFNQPYRASSLKQFWRRWHISLSSWLRDYLYISIGGSRQGKLRTYLNRFVTMLLGGVWHGANWTFVLWGSLHGAWLAIEDMIAEAWPKNLPKMPTWLGILITFHIVVSGWILFRATDIHDAGRYFSNLLAWRPGNTLVTPLSAALVLLGGVMNFGPPDIIKSGAARIRHWPAATVGLTVAVLILLIDIMRPEGVAPFIYYRF